MIQTEKYRCFSFIFLCMMFQTHSWYWSCRFPIKKPIEHLSRVIFPATPTLLVLLHPSFPTSSLCISVFCSTCSVTNYFSTLTTSMWWWRQALGSSQCISVNQASAKRLEFSYEALIWMKKLSLCLSEKTVQYLDVVFRAWYACPVKSDEKRPFLLMVKKRISGLHEPG